MLVTLDMTHITTDRQAEWTTTEMTIDDKKKLTMAMVEIIETLTMMKDMTDPGLGKVRKFTRVNTWILKYIFTCFNSMFMIVAFVAGNEDNFRP